MELQRIPLKYYVDDPDITPVFSEDIDYTLAIKGTTQEKKEQVKIIIATAPYKNMFLFGTYNDYLLGQMLSFDLNDFAHATFTCLLDDHKRIHICLEHSDNGIMYTAWSGKPVAVNNDTLTRTIDQGIQAGQKKELLLSDWDIFILKKQLVQSKIEYDRRLNGTEI